MNANNDSNLQDSSSEEKPLPIDGLAAAFHECLEEESIKCADPYDLYINRIKASLYANPGKISSRLTDGYKALLKVLEHSGKR